MKTLNITFTDAEFKRLFKAKQLKCKGNLSWHEFILRNCCIGVKKKND